VANQEERPAAVKPAGEAAWSLPPQPAPEPAPLPAAPATKSSDLPPPEVPLQAYGYALPPVSYATFVEPARDTLQALGKLRLAVAVSLVATGVSAGSGALQLYLYVDTSIGRGLFDLPPLVGLQLVAAMVQVVALALGWSALEELADAAVELHSAHVLAARRAVNFMYLATAAWCIGHLAAVAVYGSYMFTAIASNQLGSVRPLASLSFTGALAITRFAVNALSAVALQSAVASLMRERGRTRTRPFYTLALGGTGASVVVTLLAAAVLNGPDPYALLGLVSGAALAVYLTQIREAEAGSRVMAVTRGNDPDAPMPAAPGALAQMA